jgi:hypothetical protein
VRVQAYMPVLNEADIVGAAVRHLVGQGVPVHVLDGWSTDGSAEIARDAGATVEQFPATGPESKQVTAAIMNRVEHLAQAYASDWCYYTDADEIRRAPRAGETLIDAIARADAEGWNVIDHKTFVFYPTDETFPHGGNPESHFRYFTDQDKVWCHLGQEKLWKNDTAVKLGPGGHRIERADKRVSPEQFSLKHFPWRSRAHWQAKLSERVARRCEPEHRLGWGIHYDRMIGQAELQHPPLRHWRDTSAPFPDDLRLNLGCSDQMVPGCCNVDIVPPCDLIADLTKPWPWPDSSVNLIRAHDIIEHLPDKIFTMNELWRVLIPGGQVEIIVPTTDGRAAYQDPTHVAFWNRHSFWYYTAGNAYRERFAKSYGIRAAFKVLTEMDMSSVDGPKLGILMEAVK